MCACVWSRVLCEGQYTNLVWRDIGHAAKQSSEKTVYQIIMLFPTADLQRCTVKLLLLKLTDRDTLTLAHYACIFSMDTFVLSKTWMLTILNEVLVSLARDIIHPDRTMARSKPEGINNEYLKFSMCTT